MKVKKIIRTRDSGNLFDRRYQALKKERFSQNGSWEKHGRTYNITGIYSLFMSGANVTVSLDIKQDYLDYLEYRKKKKARFGKRRMRQTEGNLAKSI